jgi:hypothetical protein
MAFFYFYKLPALIYYLFMKVSCVIQSMHIQYYRSIGAEFNIEIGNMKSAVMMKNNKHIEKKYT